MGAAKVPILLSFSIISALLFFPSLDNESGVYIGSSNPFSENAFNNVERIFGKCSTKSPLCSTEQKNHQKKAFNELRVKVGMLRCTYLSFLSLLLSSFAFQPGYGCFDKESCRKSLKNMARRLNCCRAFLFFLKLYITDCLILLIIV